MSHQRPSARSSASTYFASEAHSPNTRFQPKNVLTVWDCIGGLLVLGWEERERGGEENWRTKWDPAMREGRMIYWDELESVYVGLHCWV